MARAALPHDAAPKEVTMALQLSLPLETGPQPPEGALRLAWQRSGLRIPFHVALQDRALVICLRCLSDATARRSQPPRRSRSAPTPACS